LSSLQSKQQFNLKTTTYVVKNTNFKRIRARSLQ
jgi:hypothetical protein